MSAPITERTVDREFEECWIRAQKLMPDFITPREIAEYFFLQGRAIGKFKSDLKLDGDARHRSD